MKKKEIVFDSLKRKNFLTGFQKRKNERRARAKEQLEREIKEERKRIRNDIKNSMANMKKTFQPLVLDPEIEEKVLEKEYEDDEVEINVIELAPGNKNLDEESDNDSNSSESTDKGFHINSIPGMELNVESVEKEKEKKPKQVDNPLSELGKIGNKKTLDRLKKKKALKEFKKSKIFKQKERADKKKQHKARRALKHKSKSNENGTFGNKTKHNRFKRGHSSGRGKRR
ncbi:nucleolar protein 12 [Bactrocera dorsalis]|uniref:Nucleolar protein 12 n=1 Tax=Bactrocera dorsalis TaxID=27457 RepID=A0A6I9UYX1_BACDO|nr:nucleolar protein 12 [Bactrocera dorsalis]